jgi:N6-adenosine-specific RNA methylase IME4
VKLVTLSPRFTPTGLDLPRSVTPAQWKDIGRQLARIGGAHQWWIGDWLLEGDHRYGVKFVEAVALLADTGMRYEEQTLRNCQFVASSVDKSRRRETLSWAHHGEVASFEPKDQARWLDKAEKHEWTREELRAAIRDARQKAASEQGSLDLPDGVFDLIYADPPWRYDFPVTASREIENHYQTLTVPEIAALDIASIAAKDAVLFLWATAPKVPEALQVAERWGFAYRTCAVWDKEIMGMGHWFRGMHELLFVCAKGEPTTPPDSVLVSSMIRERRGEHSAKPDRAREILEAYYPHARRVELFARERHPGWTAWGNEMTAARPQLAAVR